MLFNNIIEFSKILKKLWELFSGEDIIKREKNKQILTINNQLRFGGDLADTVLGLANINSLVAGDYIFYYQTFISVHNFGPK